MNSTPMRSRPTHPPPRGGSAELRAGFSVVEIIIVLFVVSILAYVAVPNVEVVRFRMDGAARGAMAALVSSQRLAVKRQHDVVVAFDTANRRLLIHQDRDNDGGVDADEPVRPVGLEEGVRFGRGPAPARAGASSVITFTESQDGRPALRFLRSGSASEEGTFYLTSTRSDTNGEFAKDTRAVRVDRPTGRVTWFAYIDGSWSERY